MDYDHAIMAKMIEADGLIDKLELETAMPLGHREFLARYQAKAAANVSTRKDEDIQLAKLFLRLMQHVVRNTK